MFTSAVIGVRARGRAALLPPVRPRGHGQRDMEGRKASQTRLLELRGKEWLAANVSAIRAEVKRLSVVARLVTAIRLTAANTLTTKNNEIASAELVIRSATSIRTAWRRRALAVVEETRARAGRIQRNRRRWPQQQI